MKQNVSLERDESGYDYDPDSDSETDEASLREKTPCSRSGSRVWKV